MSDITMCHGIGCEVKRRCYRHIANPSEFMQSWFSETPMKKDGSCEYFWEVESNRNYDVEK